MIWSCRSGLKPCSVTVIWSLPKNFLPPAMTGASACSIISLCSPANTTWPRGTGRSTNWQPDNPAHHSGHSETVALDQVPQAVLKAAVKSSSLIGDGLYGVDLKEVNGKVYVIEINDNTPILMSAWKMFCSAMSCIAPSCVPFINASSVSGSSRVTYYDFFSETSVIHPATTIRPVSPEIGNGVFATEFIPREHHYRRSRQL